jgi:hypothetical protein
MSLARRIKTLERTMPRPVVTPVVETRDLDQYQAILDATAMRADGRLAPGMYLDGMIEWQRELLDDYGEAIGGWRRWSNMLSPQGRGPARIASTVRKCLPSSIWRCDAIPLQWRPFRPSP